MSVTAKITKTVQCLNSASGSVSLGGVAYSVTAESCPVYSVPIAANQTNKEITIGFSSANLKAIILLADVDMTVKTNSTGSPDDTLSLKAGEPLVWDNHSGFAFPFAATVTKVYVTNTTAGTFSAFVFLDSTP